MPAGDPLAQFFTPPSTVVTPRVLKDGADSVGALGALNRVYINIGVYSEEWLRHFKALIGGQRDLADQARGRAEALGLLAGHRDCRRSTWPGSSWPARVRIT